MFGPPHRPTTVEHQQRINTRPISWSHRYQKNADPTVEGWYRDSRPFVRRSASRRRRSRARLSEPSNFRRSAAQDQVAWVLPSYVVAVAIMTPLTGWLAGRLGVKYVFLISVTGFTLASALCGGATSLTQLVTYRLIQGVCGARLVPLSQSVLLQPAGAARPGGRNLGHRSHAGADLWPNASRRPYRGLVRKRNLS